MDAENVIEILRRQIGLYGSQKAIAKRIGISPQYLGDILLDRRGLSPKVLDWLGMEREVIYEYKHRK